MVTTTTIDAEETSPSVFGALDRLPNAATTNENNTHIMDVADLHGCRGGRKKHNPKFLSSHTCRCKTLHPIWPMNS